MQVAPYVRRVAKEGNIIAPDYSIIDANTKSIGEIRKSINQLIWTIDASGNYLPKEIATIVELMQAVFNLQNKTLRTVREQKRIVRDKRKKWVKDNANTKTEGSEK